MAARTQAMSALPAVSPRNVTALDTSGLKPAIPPRHTGVSSLGLTEKPQASTFDKYKKGIKMRGEILQVFEKHNMRDEYDKGVNSLLTRWQVLAQHDPEGAEKTWNDSILGEELGPLKNVQGGKNRLVSFDLAKDVYQIDQRGKVTRIQEGRQAKKAPKTRTIYQGATAVNQEWDENAGSWSKVGEGQRFTKTGDGSGGAKQYSVGVEETKSVKAYLDEKYQQDANVAARIAADKNKFEQDDNNEGREFKITDITKYLSPEQRTTRIKIIEDVNKALATDKTLDYMTAVERRLQKSAESQSRKRPGMAQQARKQKLSPQQALELLRQRGRIK